MSTNGFRAYTRAKTEQWEVPAGTQANDVVIQAVDGRPGVALTARDDSTKAVTLPNGQIVGAYNVGGVGNKPGSAQVAVDGDFLLDVDGVSAGETTGTGTTGTPAGTSVYAIVSGGVVTGLTLTDTDNTKIGEIAPDGNIIDTVAPVSIGVGL